MESPLSTLPKEMIEIEFNKWLLEIDRQILRRVNKYFNCIFPYLFIRFNEIDLQVPHLVRYRKLWNEFTSQNIVIHGRVDCLKYTHSQGYNWDCFTTSRAAEFG